MRKQRRKREHRWWWWWWWWRQWGQTPTPVTHDFYFSFNGALNGGGSISGSATLVGEQQFPNVRLVTQALNGKLDFQPSSEQSAGAYTLTLSSNGGPFPL